MAQDIVRAWSEQLLIPTYKIGAPDKNPMFLEKRVYQGSSGVVYPHPVIDRVSDEKSDQPYTAVFLENRYLKIMILPELGGRVQMALDKTNGYHFIYYNRVIKPALVGLSGPWLSGGIEFNWPQHHRPSTFDPVEWRIVENTDGSQTVWCSEIERMFFTKGMHGLTLYPDRAYLEVSVQLYNRTSEPQTFLWWANPAVSVNDQYQSVFPPDVHAVMDHGKRDVSAFPIATGTYYKMNYAPGTDISLYKNIPVPTSYMAAHSDFDFLGDYDHGVQAGMLHIANHHTVPGKKQWTWGNGDFGQAWDRQLTDADGPYIELMCGAYTDNQPDFSWLMPGEEKRFTQIFMPYKEIGPATNATRDAVISLNLENQSARLGVYLTSPRHVHVQLTRAGRILFERALDLTPEKAFIEAIPLESGIAPRELTLRVLDGEIELVCFTPLPDSAPEIPTPATPAPPPEAISSNEELFLNGLHLEQYRHATYAPEAYYQAALARDPLDSRCNNALGLLLFRRGQFAQAEQFFRTAITSLTRRNPNPYDGEPYYNLGLALKMQGCYPDAFDAFYKSVWNAAWQAPAYLELARLSARVHRLDQALELVTRALLVNGLAHQARHLKITLLRHLGHADQARQEIEHALALDPMELGALWERSLLTGDESFQQLIGSDPETYLAISLDYAHAGLFEDAITLLAQAPASNAMAQYFVGWYYAQKGDTSGALNALRFAAALSPDYIFPNRLESVPVLESAIRLHPADAHAPYFLGNFWYAHRCYDQAITAWEHSRSLDATFPTVHRNLGLAYENKLHNSDLAWQSYQTAFALNPADARVFFELDQLAKKRNMPPAERLAHFEQHLELVAQRDDLTIERITLLNILGRPAEALALLTHRNFHPWEGGEGKVTGQYAVSLLEQAKQAIAEGEFIHAIQHLERAQAYPHNLGEGKLYGKQENDIFYYLGCAFAGLEDSRAAKQAWTKAAVGSGEPASPLYYNDQPPDMIFYQGLARRALGNAFGAQEIFQKLVAYGQTHLDDKIKMDYFAVSLPDFMVFDKDLNHHNRVHCHYMMALGYLGLGDPSAAAREFTAVLALNANHQGALLHRALLSATSETFRIPSLITPS